MLVRLLLTAILATTLATAQGKKGGSGGNSNNMGDVPRARTLSKFEMFAEKLKLNKEQKDDAINALSAAMEASAPVREQMDKSRVAVGAALIDGKTGDELKKLTDDLTGVSAQLIAVEAKAFSKIYAGLKPNQQAKAGQAFELLAETIDRPGGAGRNGGGRKKQ